MEDTNKLSRNGPVHFQSLEMELDQVKQHFSGQTLNAGCGNRDISAILLNLGADHVVNYDIESSIPNAQIGPLKETPFSSGQFDTIFCNAVLEHVPEVSKVMTEMVRILKPDGKIIAAIPFLQPFHLAPTDYRRYTRDGLVELGQMHDLRHLEIIPVHNITQTLGWIAWEWAKEKGRLQKILVYPLIWLSTRVFYKTDFSVTNNANAYQIVFAKVKK